MTTITADVYEDKRCTSVCFIRVSSTDIHSFPHHCIHVWQDKRGGNIKHNCPYAAIVFYLDNGYFG